ncbi:G-protein coupled receptor 143-like isoform X2 [Dendronephthya gigantea]|nr:G-protein coupled receptor 143-like isoform X2 [Dendronephthya gigantea]
MVLEIPASRKEGLKTITYIPKHDSVYAPIGTIIEMITLFGYFASYIWTFSYALDTCFQIYKKECPMIVYHIIAWCIPLELIAIIEAVNWIEYPLTCESGAGSLSRVYLSYTPVMIVMVVNPIIFIITYNKVKQQLRSSGSYTDAHRSALYTCRRKFFWMVIVFTVCWLPNIFSITYFLNHFKEYSHKKSNLDIFWYIEAFLNPLQGIFNYFLYRRAFRVTATDTRPEPNALPRVKRVPSERLGKFTPRQVSKNRTLQRIMASTSSQDEEAPLIRPRSAEAPPQYVYNSRLLGHEDIGKLVE